MKGDVYIDVDTPTYHFARGSKPTDEEKLDLIRREIVDQIRYEWRFRKHTKRHFTQKKFAAEVGMHQPEISDILRGRLERFTTDRLMLVLIRCGLRPYTDWAGTWFSDGGIIISSTGSEERK